MNKILEYVKEIKHFEPGQYHGFYDKVPFTHEEYCEYVQALYEELVENALDFSRYGALIQVMPFTVDGQEFVLRHCEFGEYVDELMTREEHQRCWNNGLRLEVLTK